MASETIVMRVRKGMEVLAADGKRLGKVAAVWLGTDPTASNPRCDEELCSRLELHHGFLGRRVLYIPYNVIAGVSTDHVILTVDAVAVHEHDWVQRPAWIAG